MKRLKDWNPTFWQANQIALRLTFGGFALMIPILLGVEGLVWNVLCVLGWIGCIIAGVIKYRFWCCPYCGKQLPMRGGSLEFCSACGAKLERE